MKQILTYIALILFSFPAHAEEGYVRGFIWGIGKEDVKKFERVVLFEELENTLFFIDEWDGVKTLIGYEFWEDQLIRASISFQKENYPNPSDAIAFYVAREFDLNDALGSKGEQEVIWKDYHYENMPNHFPLAVLNGHVDLVTRWETSRSDITMGMSAQDFEYAHRIVYESRELMAARTQALEEDLGPVLAPPALQE